MFFTSRRVEAGIILLLLLSTQYFFFRLMRELPVFRQSLKLRRTLSFSHIFVVFWIFLGICLRFSRFDKYSDPLVSTFFVATTMLWGVCAVGTCVVLLLWKCVPPYQLERRRFLRVARAVTLAAPTAVTAFGAIIQRRDYQLSEVKLRFRGLPPDLNGIRIVQLSDLHFSPYLSEADLAHVIGMANETRAHIALVTGDLITRAGDPLDLCLRHLSRLKAEVGVFGCLGNHEVYANCEDYTTSQAAAFGLRFLRRQAARLKFGNASLNLAGVDYQRMREPYLLGAETLVDPSAGLNVLLSHNPDVFPVAARQGFDLTIAGHTHGGQVNVEILHQNLNIARFYTPFVSGLYEEGRSRIYVNRGIGTIGLPARIGVRPEVAVLELCAI